MASPDYVAYVPATTFVDDVAGAGGTPLDATHINGLRADLITFIQTHINGQKQDGSAGNNHATADVLDATVLSEALAYANTAGGGAGAGGLYTQFQRNDMVATLIRGMLGGAGSLAARYAAFAGNAGSDITSMWTKLTAASPNLGGGTLVQRDANGAASFGNLSLAPNVNLVGLFMQGPLGYNVNYVTIADSGSNPVFLIDKNKLATFGGVVTAPGFSGDGHLLTGIVASSLALSGITGTGINVANDVVYSNGTNLVAGAFTNALVPIQTLTQDRMASLALSGTGASNTLSVAANGSYVNSLGLMKTITAGTTFAPTIPTTGNQWAAIYGNDSGALAAVYGTVGGSRDTAVLPLTSAFVPKWVYLPQNCVGIYSSQAPWTAAGSPANKGYIDDIPLNGGVMGGGGGGGTGAPTTAAYWLNGTNGSLPNGLDSTNPSTAGTIHPGLVKGGAGEGTLADGLSGNMQFNPMDRFSVSGATLNFAAGTQASGSQSPAFLNVAGHVYKQTAVKTATTSGTSGTRYVALDWSAGDGTFSPVLLASGVTSSQQLLIGLCYYDATGTPGLYALNFILSGYVDSLATVLEVRRITPSATTGNPFTSTGGYTQPTIVASPASFYLPAPALGRITLFARGAIAYASAGTSVVSPQSGVTIAAFLANGVSLNQIANTTQAATVQASEKGVFSLPRSDFAIVQAGWNQLTVKAITVDGTTACQVNWSELTCALELFAYGGIS